MPSFVCSDKLTGASCVEGKKTFLIALLLFCSIDNCSNFQLPYVKRMECFLLPTKLCYICFQRSIMSCFCNFLGSWINMQKLWPTLAEVIFLKTRFLGLLQHCENSKTHLHSLIICGNCFQPCRH
jgi:hypothetical protein